ncbi:uncharacterized protein DDB_G0283357-like [Physella acuta]|uniref:uncharacterized protein DDB_G0283357-like n=1 Tax=Physella acuta TaxID=109671 RepID=UPI0027DE5F85|nr:uncharacterized protein DDB_G0283357-like [Physella acuta]
MHNNLISFGQQSQNIYGNEQDTWQQRQEETYFTGNGSISGIQPHNNQTQKYFTNQSSNAAASYMPMGFSSPQIPNPTSVVNSFPTCVTNFKGLANNNVMPSPSPSVNSTPAVGLATMGASILSQFLSNIQLQQLGIGANVLQDNNNKSFFKLNPTQPSPSDCDSNYYSFPNESYMTNSATSMTVGTSGGISGMGSNGNTNNIDVMNVGSAMNSGNSLRTNVGNSVCDSIGSVNGSNTNTINSYNSSNGCLGNTAENFSSTSAFGSYTSENNVGSNNAIHCGTSQNASTAGMGSNRNSQNAFLDKYESVNSSRKRIYDAASNSNHYKGTEVYYQSSPSSEKFENDPSELNHNHSVYLSPQNFDQWVLLKKKLHKSDDELAQYLFSLHNKGCFQCTNRHEEKSYSRPKQRFFKNDYTCIDEEVVKTALTEEEEEMKKCMGFSGFKTTKGSRVQDNCYNSVCSVGLPRPEDRKADTDSKSLTLEEKRIILAKGGFCVFAKASGFLPNKLESYSTTCASTRERSSTSSGVLVYKHR